MVWVTAVILIVVYVGIWWAISRIRITSPPPSTPPTFGDIHPAGKPAKFKMKLPDRMKMELHDER